MSNTVDDSPRGAVLLDTFVPTLPVAKGRHRLAIVGGHARAYTPAKTAAAEAVLAYTLQQVAPATPWDEPLDVQITVVLPVPASWSGRRRQQALAGLVRPTGRPDWDNYGKLICDAANGVLWRDDAVIVEAHVRKVYGGAPGIGLRVARVGVLV